MDESQWVSSAAAKEAGDDAHAKEAGDGSYVSASPTLDSSQPFPEPLQAPAEPDADPQKQSLMRPAKFVTGSLMRHVVVMTLTSTIGMMATFSVLFLDMLFVSMLGNTSYTAAIGFGSTIFELPFAGAIGTMVAGSALVARTIGAGHLAAARQMTTNILLFATLIGLVLALVVLPLLDPLLSLLGAGDDAKVYAIEYCQVLIPSLPLVFFEMCAGGILRAHGDAKRAMLGKLLGSLLNGVLDPILIFGLGWKLRGAAAASNLSRLANAPVPAWFLYRHHGGFSRTSLTSFVADARRVCGIALPASLSNLAAPVSAAYIMHAMAPFGKEAVAGVSIVARLAPFAFGVVYSVAGALGPVIGQNVGARRFERVLVAYNCSIVFLFGYVASISLLLLVLRGVLADIFGLHGLSRQLVFLFCGPLAPLWFFNGMIMAGSAACNNLKAPFVATAVNWLSKTVGVVPFVALLASPTRLGASGVLIGRDAGAVLFAILSWVLVRHLIRRRSAWRSAKSPCTVKCDVGGAGAGTGAVSKSGGAAGTTTNTNTST